MDFISLSKGVWCNSKKLLTLTDLAQASPFSSEKADSQRKVGLELMADADCKKRF